MRDTAPRKRTSQTSRSAIAAAIAADPYRLGGIPQDIYLGGLNEIAEFEERVAEGAARVQAAEVIAARGSSRPRHGLRGDVGTFEEFDRRERARGKY